MRRDYGQQEPWLTVLYQMYREVDDMIGLTTFVTRLLIPTLDAIQQQLEDYSLLHVLGSSLVSELRELELNVNTLPNLFRELQLSTTHFRKVLLRQP